MKRISLLLLASIVYQPVNASQLFNINTDGFALTVTTTIPNHLYSSAGIKFNTPGFSMASGCNRSKTSGYCIFPVSDKLPAVIPVMGSGSIATYSATLCLNGNGPMSCQQFDNLQYIGPARFAYIANYGETPSVLACTLDMFGAIETCQDTGGGIPAGFGANGITLNNAGNTAFLTGFSEPRVYQCPVNASTGTFSNCTFTTITTPSGYTPEYGMLVLNPTNTLAYIGDNSGRILACPIANNVIQGDCVDTGAIVEDSISGVTLNRAGTVFYGANYGAPEVTVCAVNGGTFSSCVQKTGGGAITFTEPGGVVLNRAETLVYITDYNAGKVYACSTTPNNTSSFANCFTAASGITEAWGIALNAANTVAYVTDFSGLIYTCPVNTDATFGSCTITSGQVIEGTGIALGYS